ncbi:TetR/AcrR family transcriptional regulator (plasmid) [Sphingomonas paeninsulae]|uniref:TetR/AcrR family transcriptional regulator n=1 Tax=Sphingomonas paeninsulae TaxID=2319844 RepID=A0A494THI6_SPHPE|nr:TetR/AcrR family transcriptional regulator [Sphingomonas paeninsulae]AYJ85306.1 TetR/AcrR family transcriptional regulator [Sphingomonas paeninsulae]
MEYIIVFEDEGEFMVRVSRQQSRIQTRERIRSAARREFSRRGYGATTIDVITEAAGFSRGAFYANYESKQDLLLELMTESHEQEVVAWTDLVAHSDNLDALLAELERRFDEYAAQRDWWLLHAELQLEAERHETVGKLHRLYSERTTTGLEALFSALFNRLGVAGVLTRQLLQWRCEH